MTDPVECCCCRGTRRQEGARPIHPRGRRLSRLAESAGWIVTSAGLVFMPKCPICLAGYVAVFTGASLPYAEAVWLRTGLMVFCGASLVFLTGCRLYSCFIPRVMQANQQENSHVYDRTSPRR